jgi:hypothetical protein
VLVTDAHTFQAPREEYLMSYGAEISRTNPSMFLFLIDQSGSMQDKFGGGSGSKGQKVADAINKLLQNLVIKCAKSEGVRDYYHVGVVGYGTTIGPAFEGELSGRDLVPISELADAPVEIEERMQKVDDGAGGLAERRVRFPIWFRPVANGGTPMCQAINMAEQVISQWLMQHPDCFPPIVINITDGEATDGDPSLPARNVSELKSSDGNVLFFNVHISSVGGALYEFPSSESELPDQYAKQLFNMSSILPDYMREIARQEGYKVDENSRGFVFNADIVSVIRFLDIGTRPSNLR